MKVLVINGGSSSIKVKLMCVEKKECIYEVTKDEIIDYDKSLQEIFNELDLDKIDVFAHRVVHGGDKYSTATTIDDECIIDIEKLSSLAPLHNPVNLRAIIYIKNNIKDAKQVAVFDTAFHQSIPQVAHTYALPYEFYEKYRIKRYGFHGTSHKFLTSMGAKALNKDIKNINLISLHLGNGASICAIKDGQSIDTTMGFTPLEGLIMGTRSGDIDSQIIFWLEKNTNLSFEDISNILNKKSGLLGIAKKSNMRELEILHKKGDKLAILAIDMFVYRIKKYIGAFKEILERVDAIIISGGIGENSHFIRSLIFKNIIDVTDSSAFYNQISTNENKILVIKTNEELQIANEAYELLK
jgi:acetate kinase